MEALSYILHFTEKIIFTNINRFGMINFDKLIEAGDI